MGGAASSPSSSSATSPPPLSLRDVERAREGLLVALRLRCCVEQAQSRRRREGDAVSMHSRLLQSFQRFDSAARGTVPLEAAFVIAHDLALDVKWTHEQVERFAELFRRLEGDATADATDADFDYRLFLSFLFFPLEHAPSTLRLQASASSAAPGRFASVHPSEFAFGASGAFAGESDGGGALVRGVPTTAKKLALVLAARTSSDGDSSRGCGDGCDDGCDDDAVAKLREDVNLLRLFSHPNVTRYYGTLRAERALYVVEERHPSCCSLRTILESFGAMKEPTIRRYLLQMLQALQFLHARGISHGSLSTQTVSIDSYGLLRLCEFGIDEHLRQLSATTTAPAAAAAAAGAAADAAAAPQSDEREWTSRFPPPETTSGRGRRAGGAQSDVWRVGVLVLQMASGFKRESDARADPLSPPPSSSGSYGRPRRSSSSGSSSSPQKRSGSLASPRAAGSSPRKPDPKSVVLPALPHSASKPLRTLVRACLRRDPRKRATADELVQADFFQVDAAQATDEMLRGVCTDLDASMRRLMSSSASASAARSPMSGKRTPAVGSGSPIRMVPARSGSGSGSGSSSASASAFASSPVYVAAHTRARASSAATPTPAPAARPTSKR